ncbi:MAG: IS1595 family transposase [Planctomycetes bacterium]|nr:IS1595 family transposase [Planctomycetota bacterium]
MAKKKPCKVGENKSQVVRDMPNVCSDEDAAVRFMEAQRWGDEPCCPRCGDMNVYQVGDRKTGGRNTDYRWRCRACKRYFTVRTGSVMAETRIPLRYWCYAFWQVCSSKKGVSAKQIHRQTGLSYKSALFLLHRIRFALADMEGVKLMGTVEVDELYLGGRPRYRIPYDPLKRPHRPKHPRKQPIIGVLSRDSGTVKTRVIPDVTSHTLRRAVSELVDKSAKLETDEAPAYVGIGRQYAGHQAVKHSNYEYVREGVTTNTIESFFAILRRGITGIYHNVSRKHLQRYLDEFEFRYNTRALEDGERTVTAIQGAVGKRLLYRQPNPA